jgi:flagellin-like hook-associated protein FlgL
MSFNFNIGSVSANILYSLSSNTQKLGQSIEKISSGLRINRGSDDAAGITISEKLRGQIRGLSRAIENCQNGVSMVQTADGALSEVSTTLNRIRELAIQAQNDSYTTDERLEIQKEIEAMVAAVDDIASKTEFNNKKLLDGSAAHKISTDNKGLKLFSDASKLTDLESGRYSMNVELSEYGKKETQKSNAFFLAENGEGARLKSRLSDLYMFRDVDFTKEQTIIINSHSARTSVKIDAMTTISELCDSLKTAIGKSKDEGGLGIPETKVWFDDGSKQLIVESGLYGRAGQIEYTANENLSKALGFQITNDSEEPAYKVSVKNANGGVNDKMSTEGGRTEILSGINADFTPPMPVETSFELTFKNPGADWIIMSIIDTNRDIGFGNQWYHNHARLEAADSTLIDTGNQLISEGYVPEENSQTSVTTVAIPPTEDLTPEKFVELMNQELSNATVPANVRVSISEKRVPLLITGDTGTSAWLKIRGNQNAMDILGHPYHEGPIILNNPDSGGSFGEIAGSTNISIFTAPVDFRFRFTDADGYNMTSSLFLRGEHLYHDMATQLNSELRANGIKVSLYTDTNSFRAISTESGTDTTFQIDVIVPRKAVTLAEDISFTMVDTNRDIGEGRIPDGVPQTAEAKIYIPAGHYTLTSIEEIINKTIADIPNEVRPSIYAVFSDDYDGRTAILGRNTRESGYVVYDGSGDFILQLQDNHVGTSSYISLYDVNPAASALLGLHEANATGSGFQRSVVDAQHCILEPVYNPRFAISITDADGRAFLGVDVPKDIDLRDYPFGNYVTDNDLKVRITPFADSTVSGTTITTTVKDHQINEEFQLTFREYWYTQDQYGKWRIHHSGDSRAINIPVGELSDFNFNAALAGSTFGVTLNGDNFTAINRNPKSPHHYITMTVSGASTSNFNEGVEKLGLETRLGRTFRVHSTETGNDTIFNTQFMIAPLLRAESPIENDMVQNSFVIKTTDYHGGVFTSDAINYGVSLADYDFNAINPDNLVYILKMPDGHLEFEAVHVAKDIEYKVEFLEASNFLGVSISSVPIAFGDFRLAVIRGGEKGFGENIEIDTNLSSVGNNYLTSSIANITKLDGKLFTESAVFGDEGYELRVEAKAHKLGAEEMIRGKAPADFVLYGTDSSGSFVSAKTQHSTEITGILNGYNLGGASQLSFTDGKLAIESGGTDFPLFVNAASYTIGNSQVSGTANQDIRFVLNRDGNTFYGNTIDKNSQLSTVVGAGFSINDVNIGLNDGRFFASSNHVDDGSFSLNIESKTELVGGGSIKSDLTLEELTLSVTRGGTTVTEQIASGTNLTDWVSSNGNAFSALDLILTNDGGSLKLKATEFGGPEFYLTISSETADTEIIGGNNIPSGLSAEDFTLRMSRNGNIVERQIPAGTSIADWINDNVNTFAALDLAVVNEAGKLKITAIGGHGTFKLEVAGNADEIAEGLSKLGIEQATLSSAEGMDKFGLTGASLVSTDLTSVRNNLGWNTITHTNSDDARKEVMRSLGLSPAGFRLRVNSGLGDSFGDKIDRDGLLTDILSDYEIGERATAELRDGKLFIQAADHDNNFSVDVEACSYGEAEGLVEGNAEQDFRIVAYRSGVPQYGGTIEKGGVLTELLAGGYSMDNVKVGLRDGRLFAESSTFADNGFSLGIEGKAELAGTTGLNTALTNEGFTIQITKGGQTIEQEITSGKNIKNWLESEESENFLGQVGLTVSIIEPDDSLIFKAATFDSQSFEVNILGSAAQISEGVNRLGLGGANVQSTNLDNIKSQLKWDTIKYTSSEVAKNEVLLTMELADIINYTSEYIADDVGIGLGLSGRSENTAINANILDSLGFKDENEWNINSFGSHSDRMSPYDIEIVLERMGLLDRGPDFNSRNGALPLDTSKIAAGKPYSGGLDYYYSDRARFRPDGSVAAATNPYVSWAADSDISYGALYMTQLLGIVDAKTAETSKMHNEDRVMLKSSSGTDGDPIIKALSILPRTYITENEEKEFTTIDRYGNFVTISLVEQIAPDAVIGISREELLKKMPLFERTDIHWEFENDIIRFITKTAGEKAVLHLSKEVDKEKMEPGNFIRHNGYGENDYNFMVGDNKLIYQVGANQNQHINIRIGDFGADALGVKNIDCTSVRFATAAIGLIDDAINQVSSTRAMLGAAQNRMVKTMDNLHNSSINLQSAESKIRDLDIAEELVKNKTWEFLRQAGMKTFQDNIQLRKQIANVLIA